MSFASSPLERIGVFTSGGDAPGMNAAVRAVVRTCLYYQKQSVGIFRGYDGMIAGDIKDLSSRSVSNIIQRGGTILKSARSLEFKTKEGRRQAYENLKSAGVDALVAIGGDGTFRGATLFSSEYDIPVVGIPGTIDNDLNGTDYTIGYDTAVNTAAQAIDKVRDTASSHNRLFFIEVMGRDSGQIALRASIAAGAEATMIPEQPMDIDELVRILESGAERKKSSSLVVVAEGGKPGRSIDIAREVNERFSYYDTKVTILGHLLRGGSPTVADRVLASRLGVAAVEGLLNNISGQMVGIVNNQIKFTPFGQATTQHDELEKEMLRIATILSV
ncbi:MAG: 6-phosphofructokinase [Bacteroidia bacterium]|jgi:6-phosphofructokinase 1|nr:6-phosphofructokinase [Bacteroidia bacterium]MCC6768511.1 6-phosphofructokinase [Bacteroidia bacterium]